MYRRKWMIGIGGVLAVLVLFIGSTAVWAHGPNRMPGRGGFAERSRPVQHVVRAISETLGLSPEELRAELQAGKTVADIAAEQGVPLEDVVAAITTPLGERLEQRVAAGDLTQEEADTILAVATQKVETWLNQPWPVPTSDQRGQWIERARQVFADIAEALRLSPEELRAELQAGKTVADIAAEQGVPLEDVVAAITTPLGERLEQRVAAGDLTQEEADILLAAAQIRVTHVLERGGSLRELLPAHAPTNFARR